MTETNRRVGRCGRLLASFQSAKGTVVSDFTTSDTVTLWAENVQIPAGRRKSVPGPWMTTGETENTTSRYSLPENPEGQLLINATEESVEWLLRSNWGQFAGGSFTLATQVNEWLTLAWIEDNQSGATDNLIRIPDVWIHTLELQISEGRGIMQFLVSYAGADDVLVNALDSLPGGVTLPTAPAQPSDFDKFCTASATVVRDPASANVTLNHIEATVTFDQGLRSEWTMTDGWEVSKRGKTKAKVNLRANTSDESWVMLTNNRAGTLQRFKITAASDAGTPKTLTMNFYNMDFEVEPLGRTGLDAVEFTGTGQAHTDGTNFVTIAFA